MSTLGPTYLIISAVLLTLALCVIFGISILRTRPGYRRRSRKNDLYTGPERRHSGSNIGDRLAQYSVTGGQGGTGGRGGDAHGAGPAGPGGAGGKGGAGGEDGETGQPGKPAIKRKPRAKIAKT